MGFLDRLLGRTPMEQDRQMGASARHRAPGSPASPQEVGEDRAVARYRYLLRTAPPEQLEALHAEAFARLTPEQRQQLLHELSSAAPGEVGATAEPADLARVATRAEMRHPGTLESTFSRGGSGLGGAFAGSMMGTVAGVVIGSSLANLLFTGYDQSPEAQQAGDTGDTGGSDVGAGDATGGGDAGSGGWSGSDWGSGGGGDGFGGGGDFGGAGDFGGF